MKLLSQANQPPRIVAGVSFTTQRVCKLAETIARCLSLSFISLVVISFFAFDSLAQVKIRERVEILPQQVDSPQPASEVVFVASRSGQLRLVGKYWRGECGGPPSLVTGQWLETVLEDTTHIHPFQPDTSSWNPGMIYATCTNTCSGGSGWSWSGYLRLDTAITPFVLAGDTVRFRLHAARISVPIEINEILPDSQWYMLMWPEAQCIGTGPDEWSEFFLEYVQPEKRIKLAFGRSGLRTLTDRDNRNNPNYSPNGPDRRRKVIDWSKRDTTQLKITITDGQERPMPDCSVVLTGSVRPESGGHDHTTDRPTGRFIVGSDTLTEWHGTTGEDGTTSCVYLTSGFGGFDSIFAQGEGPRDTATGRVPLSAGQLIELEEGARYELVGAYGEPGVNSRHTSNHFGTADALDKIKRLADSIYVKSGSIMRINDMSLMRGGPFDITNNWDTPHQYHREGVSVDIDDVDAQGRTLRYKFLVDTSKKISPRGSFGNEGNHYHWTIR